VEGFRGVPPPAIQSGTLFGLSGAKLRRMGAILLIVGIVMFLVSSLPAFLAMNRVAADPFQPGGFDLVSGSFFLSFLLGSIGFILIAVGAIALRLGMVQPVSGYLATEAGPAIRTASSAIGAGLRDVGFGPAAAPPTVVRVKCRNCGYLETEDAEFCSKCGQRI
jgi:uncharacterized membrane protein